MFSFPFKQPPAPDINMAGPRRSPLLFIVFVLILCGITGFYSFLRYGKIVDDTEILLNSIAIEKSEQISFWRSAQLIGAKQTGGDMVLGAAAAAVIKTRDPAAMAEITDVFDNFKESYDFQTSVLLDHNLKPILTNTNGLGLSIPGPMSSLRAFFKEADDTGIPIMTDIVPMPGGGEPVVEIIIPVFDRIHLPSNHVGYIVHYIGATKELSHIVETWPFHSETGESLLIERNGTENKVLKKLMPLFGSSFSTLPRSEFSKALDSMLGEKEGRIYRGKNYADVPSFAVSRSVEGTNWVLVSVISRREVMKPWWSIIGLMSTFQVIGIVVFHLIYRNLDLRRTRTKIQTLLETERKLRTTEKKFLAFMDKMPSMAMIMDKDSRVLSVNKAMTAHFHAEVWIEKSTEERLPPDQAKASMEWNRKVFENGDVEFEETRTDKHEQLLHLFTQKFRIEDGDGAPLIGLITTDMTERGETERQIREMNSTLERMVRERTAKLEEVNLELQAFAYTVSHDLRSPLRSMNEYADLLKNDCADSIDEDGQRHLEGIRNASRRMGEFMDDFLEISRISNAKLKIQKVNVGKIANSIISRHIIAAPDRVVSISTTPSMIAECDATLAEILFGNLIDNAFAFTEGQPVTTIELGSKIEESRGKPRTVFFVRDNGKGIDMADADRLFKPFQWLSESTNYSEKSAGLALAKRVVERHGGRIWIESALGKESTVSFTLSPESA